MKRLIGTGAAVVLLTAASLISGAVSPGKALAAGCPVLAGPNTTDSCPVNATVTLSQGVLSIQAPTLNPFGALTLNGQNQTTNATWTATSGPANNGKFRIVDASGTGNGWYVTAQSPAFSCTTGVGSCQSNDTFPQGELNGGGFVSASCTTGLPQQHCGAAGTRGALPVTDATTGQLIDTTTGSQEFHALANTGMGTYDVALGTLNLVVPADAYASTYTTTITYTLTSGPGTP